MAAPHPRFGRRALLRGGLSVTAAGAFGLTSWTAPGAAASPRSGPGGTAEPRIYTTAEWEAREPDSEIAVEDHVPTYIVVHHTVDPGNSDDYSLDHAKQICRDIQDMHMAQGWGDTGQQFTNSRGGYVLEGRHQSLDVVRGGTQHVVGANVADHNSEVIGIENEGLYTDVDVPDALWESLVGLVSWIAAQYGTPVENIMGHRDFNSTECPGEVLYARLPELREAVAAALGVPAVETPPGWPLLRPGNAGHRVRAAQHLLRTSGFPSLRADGVFGTGTQQAVARLADTHRIARHSCAAVRHGTTDETGYLGADLWPLITPRVREGENAEVAAAVATLRRAGGERASGSGPLSAADWQLLLAA